MLSKRKVITISIACSLAIFAAGCKKKVAPPAPAPPPPAAAPAPEPPKAPTVSQFSAEPTSIQSGQSATLRWAVSGDVTSVSIDQSIGAVQNTGNRRVFPKESTTYTLTVTGPGGTSTGRATVEVTTPPPPPPAPAPAPKATLEQRLSQDVQDAYFDYDKNDIRADAREVLTKDAAALKSILADFPNATVVLEGHCDERGSAEYNVGLGDRRSSSAKEFVQQLGISATQLKTVSFGKERPQCTDASETCYQKNRRVHFSAGQ